MQGCAGVSAGTWAGVDRQVTLSLENETKLLMAVKVTL